MRILLDESLPRRLALEISGHEVQTVQKQGWAGLKNGELLRRASGSFDVLVTGDRIPLP
jgi:predicted nuclease of predicted toxin-antitoxin system